MNHTEHIVDFFIVGAPKSGTTSLAYYLSEHSEVCFSRVKEPFFYNRESPQFNGIRSREQYRMLFRHARHGQLCGEGTTWYLFSPDAIPNALAENPEAKLVVCLRNPADAVVSWHSHMILVGAESVIDVNTAWRLQEERRKEHFRPPVYGDGIVLQYHELFKVGTQLQRLYSTVDRQRVHVIFFEDLTVQPGAVYAKLLRFLGCEEDIRIDYPVKYPRSRTKSDLLRWLGSRLSYYQRIQLTYLLDRVGIDLYQMYWRLNTEKAGPGNPSTPLIPEYRRVFDSEITLLESLTGRTLTHWR